MANVVVGGGGGGQCGQCVLLQADEVSAVPLTMCSCCFWLQGGGSMYVRAKCVVGAWWCMCTSIQRRCSSTTAVCLLSVRMHAVSVGNGWGGGWRQQVSGKCAGGGSGVYF